MSGHDFDRISAALADSIDFKTQVVRLSEGEEIEFKESFNWAGRSEYAKTMAAFANNRGGYIIFGISNTGPRIVGLKSENFEKQDNAKVAEYLNALFSPAVIFERHAVTIGDFRLGLLWTAQAERRPVMAIKQDGDVREAEVYFRYNARSEKIKFPEMKAIIDGVKDAERASWADILKNIARIGPESLGIMDIKEGAIHGRSGNLMIDATLVPKLNFIKEGEFNEGGAPTLKLIGDVTPIGAAEGRMAVRITNDPTAVAVREETILDQYPLEYADVIKRAAARYSDFKANNVFHRLMQGLKSNPEYCHTRYLYRGRKTAYTNMYSPAVFNELDKVYRPK